MQEKRTIASLQPNEEIREVLLIAQASQQQSRNGPYWRVEFRDATGNVEGKIWSPLSTAFPDLPSGRFAQVSGRTSLYRDQLQVSVDAMALLEPEEEAGLNMADFLPASARSGEDMLAEMEALCKKELSHKPWRKFARSVLDAPHIRPRLLRAPAAKAVHHAYLGGLLEHSLSVAAICRSMAALYPEDIDRETLLCGALFHDIGKIEEMSNGLVTDYTNGGKMLGHIVQGLVLLEPYLQKSGVEPELALHFRHLVASHHGQHEYGSPSLPATAEAFILHYADNMDAKIVQLRSQFNAPRGDDIVWSPWNNLLERRLAQVPHTPAKEEISKKVGEATDKEGRQCSLL